jgi:MFS family permease
MTATTRSAPGAPPSRPTPTSLLTALPALVALCLAILVEMIDNQVLTVALPTIARDLEVGTTGLQWIAAAYSLTFGGLLLVGGTLGDKLGQRRMLLWGLVGFGLSSLLVLGAQNDWQLIAVRALCGVFAALIAPGTMSLVFRLFEDEATRRRAIGVIMTVSMVGVAIGPALGGLAVEHMPWQALLVVNAPIAALAWWGVRRGIPHDDPATLRPGRTDWPGAVLSVATIALGLFIFTKGVENGWFAWQTLTTAALALLAGIGFVLRERRAAHPMLNLKLFALRGVRGSAMLQVAVTVSMVGVGFASTQLFQYAWGWSPMQSGLGTLPLVAGMFLAAPLSDALVKRTGHRRTALTGCAALVAALVLLIVSISSYPGFAAGMVLLAMGIRLVITTSAVALIESLPTDHTGLGAALNDTSQVLGNSVGVAVMGTVTTAVMGTMLPTGRWSRSVIDQFVHSQRIGFAILAGLVTVFAVIGGRTLTNSTTTEEPE